MVWNAGDFICHFFGAFNCFWLRFNKFEEMNSEMEESKELADNRLIELQKLQQDLQNVHQENNNMKVFLCSASSYSCEFSESSVLAAAQKL